MLTISSGHADDILAVVASGRVNHGDVEGYLVPAIEAKLQDHASIRLWLARSLWLLSKNGLNWRPLHFSIRATTTVACRCRHIHQPCPVVRLI